MSEPTPDKPIDNSPYAVRLPIIMGLTLAAGILLGATFFGSSKGLTDVAKGYEKFKEVLLLVE